MMMMMMMMMMTKKKEKKKKKKKEKKKKTNADKDTDTKTTSDTSESQRPSEVHKRPVPALKEYCSLLPGRQSQWFSGQVYVSGVGGKGIDPPLPRSSHNNEM